MWSWFERSWSSVGLGAAVVLLALLFCTDVLRGRGEGSRWRDPIWLGWASVVAYLLHNFEEYGVDLFGRVFQFPATACGVFGFPQVSGCPFTPGFFVAVNIPFVWIVLVAAALLGRRNRAVGLTGAGLMLTNALSHLVGLATPMGYSPGTLAAAIIFIPLSVWIFATQLGPSRVSRLIPASIIGASALAQAVLLLLLLGLSRGALPLPVAIAIQVVSPGLLLLIPWLASRRRGAIAD